MWGSECLPAKNMMEDSLQKRSRGSGLPSGALMRCRNAEMDWSSAAGSPLGMHTFISGCLNNMNPRLSEGPACDQPGVAGRVVI